MRKFLMIVTAILLLLYGTALSITVEPEERRPGTRLDGMLVITAPDDWSFLGPSQRIFVQTNTWYQIPHSITTNLFVIDDQLYVPCRECAAKQWPKNVAADPRVILKIGDKLYPRWAIRIEDEAERRRLLNVPAGEPTPDRDVYRMDPRTGG